MNNRISFLNKIKILIKIATIKSLFGYMNNIIHLYNTALDWQLNISDLSSVIIIKKLFIFIPKSGSTIFLIKPKAEKV